MYYDELGRAYDNELVITKTHNDEMTEIEYRFDGAGDLGTLTQSRDLDGVLFWHGIIDTHPVIIDSDDDLIHQFEDDHFF